MFIIIPLTTRSASSLKENSKTGSTPFTKICTASLQSLDTFSNFMSVLNYSFIILPIELLLRQVCDNVGDHLIGNVYARYEWETEAQAAVDNLNDRWYAGVYFYYADLLTALTASSGRPLYAELSPVTDFREACCRQNENGECNRGGFCN